VCNSDANVLLLITRFGCHGHVDQFTETPKYFTGDSGQDRSKRGNLLPAPDDDGVVSMEQSVNDWQGKQKNCLSAALSTTNPT
jgi:hypothetical protein